MPRTIEKTVYSFNELSDKAKDTARDWYRESGLDYEWYDGSYEDFERVARILGITIDTIRDGKTLAIYWSGFSSQGDGACFKGSWVYKLDAQEAIRDYAPTDTDLHFIADALREGNRLNARVSHRDSHYSHAHSVSIDVCDDETGDDAPELNAIAVRDALRDFMNWMYRQLEKEYEYLMSDEAIDETIEANEWEFDENGHFAK